MTKIEEAQEILRDLGLPEQQQNKISALTLLALANVKPSDQWFTSTRKSLTLSKDIIEFVNNYYDQDYKANTRESFRKIALKPFIDNGIAILNPDNPNLSPTSSNTHYALSELALRTIINYDTPEWNLVVENFKEINGEVFGKGNKKNILLKKIHIENFKSIYNDEVGLGRINVFIGENGSGKSNILEALAFVGSSRSNDMSFDSLYSRGIRFARPDLIMSSFSETPNRTSIDISLEFNIEGERKNYSHKFIPANPQKMYSKWYDLEHVEENSEVLVDYMNEILKNSPSISAPDLLSQVRRTVEKIGGENRRDSDLILSEYAIYDLNTKSLRGITPPDSRKTPLGLNGEGLDSVILNFTKKERTLLERYEYFFGWLEKVFSDTSDTEKYAELKAGKSISNLYFTDRFMQAKNKMLSAENSNEGILHVLFYLSLFISNKTPKLFGIDNIETALNPRLCRVLMKELVNLSKISDKQVLITTHNPAILDGLNLLDDDQRLFEVYRNDEGHTLTRRIEFRNDLSDKKGKLSDMWMSGALGASSKNF